MNETTDATLSNGELAERSGLTTHTLRYYEDAGLIPQVERKRAGHRRYRPEHARWLGLLDRLRISGMSIARMRRYVQLVERGDETIDQRGRLLRRHEGDIEGASKSSPAASSSSGRRSRSTRDGCRTRA